jgi:hypothetical protein
VRIEVWSPDGLEAASVGELFEVVMAENEEALGLFDTGKGCRVWLDKGDVEFLREMLEQTAFGRASEAAL